MSPWTPPALASPSLQLSPLPLLTLEGKGKRRGEKKRGYLRSEGDDDAHFPLSFLTPSF